MNVLPRDRQNQIIAALCEGVSIRATERLTQVHRDTIMRFGVKVGNGCGALHDRMMQNLHVARIELDEIWGYVGKKQKNVELGDGAEKGDQWTFIALDATSKGILTYMTGKRTKAITNAFVADLRERVANRPEISSDAFNRYPDAIEAAFGADVDYGQIHKTYSVQVAREAARRYSPGHVVAVTTQAVSGAPRHICTSYIERQNLTLRMQQRRFTRLTNGFSKKVENHCAAVALYVAHYNLCRVHEALRVTPAMHLGVADHVWSIGELVEAAISGNVAAPAGDKRGPFRVIDGGRQ